jgi:hypothetical protein
VAPTQENARHAEFSRPSAARRSGNRSPADRRALIRGAGQGNVPDPHREGGAGARSATAAVGFDGLLDDIVERVAGLVAERLAPLFERPAAPALLDRRGIADALGCGVDTIDRLRDEGLPELRVGDSPRFELAAALEWLRGRA